MDNDRYTATARCPYCGEVQETEPGQDAALCRSCGKPFAVRTAVSADPAGSVYAGPGPAYYAPAPQKPRKKHTFWWIVGWIFCFPIPLTILMLRSRRLPAWARYAIIALGWLVYLLLGLRGRSEQPQRSMPTPDPAPAIVEATAAPRPTARPTPKPTPTAAPEEEPEEELEEEPEEEPEEPVYSDVVTPEFKAVMDSYEAFFDEYCDFMKSMSDDPTDLSYLMEYADMMSLYADMMEKLDSIDEDSLSPADDAYYIEVTARIEVKLLEAANYMS